jgi:hypothetical protein
MSGADSKISDRRKRNNMMLGIVLFGFVGLVFAITVAKMMAGQNMEAFDHAVRPALELAE